MTTAGNAKTRKFGWRKTLAVCIAAVLFGAIVMHQVLIAALLAAAVLAALVLFARARWTRYASGGWIAARRRRRYQGWAGFRDIRRVTRSAWTLTRRLSPGTPLMVLGTRGRARQRVAVHRENSALYMGATRFREDRRAGLPRRRCPRRPVRHAPPKPSSSSTRSPTGHGSAAGRGS